MWHEGSALTCTLPASIQDNGRPRCRWHRYVDEHNIIPATFAVFQAWLGKRKPFKTTKTSAELWALANTEQEK